MPMQFVIEASALLETRIVENVYLPWFAYPFQLPFGKLSQLKKSSHGARGYFRGSPWTGHQRDRCQKHFFWEPAKPLRGSKKLLRASRKIKTKGADWRKEGRKRGLTPREQKEERKEGRKGEREEGRREGWKQRRKEWRKERKKGRKEGGWEGKEEGKKGKERTARKGGKQ